MSSILKTGLLVLVFISLQDILFPQIVTPPTPPPIEWEVINKSDLEMTSFPADTNATAVILCDYGESFFNNNFAIEYRRHIRVKILNQNGFDWGAHSIDILTRDHTESMLEIEGITYNLDGKGNIVKTELKDDEIFEEQVNENVKRYRFAMPALKPGCIVDVKYSIESSSLFRMRDWMFQYDEPVLWSEYRVSFPKNVVYALVYNGYEPWYYEDMKTVIREFRGDAKSALHTDKAECYEYRYAVKDAPAIRTEPFITTIDDYRNQVSLQLSGYAFPFSKPVNVANTWQAYVTEELLKDDNFYKRIDDTKLVRKTLASITNGLNTPEEKLEAIYKWVSSSIVWSGGYGKYTRTDVDDVIKEKKGSVPEITFLLLSLLKSAGIQCDPIILSTRSNGKIMANYPIDAQFNYIIARAVIGSKSYFLDATDPHRPMDLLPERVLGVKALVVKDPLEWAILSSDKQNVDNSFVTMTLKEDGSISGTIEELLGEYSSLSLRNDLESKKASELVKKQYESEAVGFTIDSVSIRNQDSIKLPLRIKAYISSSSYAQQSGDMFYLNPFIIHRSTDTPFKTSIRKYPVDFGYKRSHKMNIMVYLPENYELKEQVLQKGASCESSASYVRQVKSDKNMILVTSKMDIREPIIRPELYNQLKYFFAQMVSAESLQLVIGPKQVPQVIENVQPQDQPVTSSTPVKNINSIDKKKKQGKK